MKVEIVKGKTEGNDSLFNLFYHEISCINGKIGQKHGISNWWFEDWDSKKYRGSKCSIETHRLGIDHGVSISYTYK